MAEKKYLNYEGLTDVATHVNTRLKTVTTMPVSADDGAVRLYVGTTDSTYTQGHTYKYDTTQTKWIDITPLQDISGKADKVSSSTNGDLAGLDSNGNLTDSGILATDVVQKSSTSGLLKNDGTVDTNTYLTATDINNKANMVSSATNGDLAGLDSNGDLTDSGIAATNVVVKSSTAGLIKNDGTIDTNTYATTSALSNKTDKVTSATANDFATLDASGNLTDSGINKNIVPSTATSSNKLATANDIPTELNDLSDDVIITNPVNAQLLAYNATSGKWENQTGQAVVGGAVFKGSINFANLPTTGMTNGDWYDIKDAFTTDNRFEEGSGISCAAGTDVIWVTDDSKWNILTPSGVYSFNGRTGAVSPQSGDYSASDVGLGNVVNTGDSATPVSGGTTKFTTGGAYTELNKKADKVTGTFTSGNFVSLDSSGNIADSGKKASDFTTDNQTFTQASTRANIVSGESFSTIFGKIMKWFADLKDLAFIGKDGTSSTKYLRGDGTWQAFPSIPSAYTSNPEMDGTASAGTSSNYAKGDHRHPSDTTKADKVTGTFTSGNFAGLDSNGNITDSGSKASDFSTVKSRQTPASGGTTLSLVNTGDMYNWNNKANNSVVSKTADGLAPQLPNETTTTKFLRQDGTWNVPDYPSVPSAYTSNPAMDGTASAGSSGSWARGDHVHPTDTSRAAASTAYSTSDTAETTLDDDDKVPFYDTSASGKRNSTWSNIKAKLKSYFDNLYAPYDTLIAAQTSNKGKVWKTDASTGVPSWQDDGGGSEKEISITKSASGTSYYKIYECTTNNPITKPFVVRGWIGRTDNDGGKQLVYAEFDFTDLSEDVFVNGFITGSNMSVSHEASIIATYASNTVRVYIRLYISQYVSGTSMGAGLFVGNMDVGTIYTNPTAEANYSGGIRATLSEITPLPTKSYEQYVTLGTTDTTITFNVDELSSVSIVDVYTGRTDGDVSGAQNSFPYKSIYVTSGSCTIVYPALPSAVSAKVKIYIR